MNEAIRAWGPVVGRRYIARLRALADAGRLEDVYSARALDLHPLTGDRAGQYAIRLTGQMRLVISIEGDTLSIEEVVDYHG